MDGVKPDRYLLHIFLSISCSMLCNVYEIKLCSTYHVAEQPTYNCIGNKLLGLQMFLRSGFQGLIIQKWVTLGFT